MQEGLHFTQTVYKSGDVIFEEGEAVDACSLQSKDSFLVVSAAMSGCKSP